MLAADTQIVPVSDLPTHIRNKLRAEDGDYAISRPNGRNSAKLISSEFRDFLGQFAESTTIAQAVLRYATRTSADPENVLDNAFPHSTSTKPRRASLFRS
jgi:hypothetical protein